MHENLIQYNPLPLRLNAGPLPPTQIINTSGSFCFYGFFSFREPKRTLIINFKPFIFFRFQNQLYKFPSITQLKLCQKLDSEAEPNNKLKPLIKKNVFFDFKINVFFYNAIKILPKIGFRSFPQCEIQNLNIKK